MSLFYDADKVIDFLSKHKYIVYKDWKDNNKQKYNVSFERPNGLKGLTVFEITVTNGDHLIREQNLRISSIRLDINDKDMNDIEKFRK